MRAESCEHNGAMVEPRSIRLRRRVFLPHALGGDEFLRVTWHETEGVLVFSHWEQQRCVATTPVRVVDTPELTGLLVEALGNAAQPSVSAVAPAPPTLRAVAGRALARGEELLRARRRRSRRS